MPGQTALSKANTLYKQADFGQALDKSVEALLRHSLPLDLRDCTSLKAHCLAAEVYDHRGDHRAREVVRQAPALMAEETSRRDRPALELRREQIRYLANFARIFFYRDGRYREAQQILQKCRDDAQGLTEIDKSFQCLGTRAQIAYYLGCAHRQLR